MKLLLGFLLSVQIVLFVVGSGLQDCKKAWLNEGKTSVDLTKLTHPEFYGPIPFHFNKTEDWHYYVNICGKVNKECTSEKDHFELRANGNGTVTHDDYFAIQVQNMKLPDKDHVDCNFIAARDIEEERQFLSVKCTDGCQEANPKVFVMEIVMTNGEPFEWIDEEGKKREGRRKTVIEVTQDSTLEKNQVRFENWFLETTNPPGTYKFRAFANMPIKKEGASWSKPLGEFGFGGLLILLVVMAFLIYFIVGVIVQVVRGRRGIDMIPNRVVWIAIFQAFVDGVTWLPQTIMNLVKKPSSDSEQLYDEA